MGGPELGHKQGAPFPIKWGLTRWEQGVLAAEALLSPVLSY